MDARQLRCLELDTSCKPFQNYNIPVNLLSLKRLHLGGCSLPKNLKEVQTPVLRELSLDLEEDEDYTPLVENLLTCNGIPFQQLDALTIEFDDDAVSLSDRHCDTYIALLRVCTNLKQLSGNLHPTIFLLKILIDECVGTYALTNRTFGIFCGDTFREIRAGKEEQLEDIEAFAAELGWPQIREKDERELIRELYP